METEETKKRICELDVTDEYKKVLTRMLVPQTIGELAAAADKSYSHIQQTVSIWVAKGWVHKIYERGRVRFKLANLVA